VLDLKTIRENPEQIEKALQRRQPNLSLKPLLELDRKHREMLHRVESLRNEQKTISKEIGIAMGQGKDPGPAKEQVRPDQERDRGAGGSAEGNRRGTKSVTGGLPNIPHPSVPADMNKKHNQEIRREGAIPDFGFEPKNHLELSDRLGLFDLARAAKISGSQWPMYIGDGARLEMALIQFMLEENIKKVFSSSFLRCWSTKPRCSPRAICQSSPISFTSARTIRCISSRLRKYP
jgi:seryl-tRNA synthetase